jgi:uncharacterized protein (DUF1499 family)
MKMKNVRKYVVYSIIVLSIVILLTLAYLSVKSRTLVNAGLVEGKLAKCPDTPNCICSEDYKNKNFEPIQIHLENKTSEWAHLKQAIRESGGEIHQDTNYYLHATFVTPIFRFVDDFEARIDTVNSCIHLRSASRVGDYDFGTNLKRVNRVVKIYKLKNLPNE